MTGWIKHDPEYISYVESGESAAVFITRNICKDIKTGGKWVDVTFIDGFKMNNGTWKFNSFEVELFPRITKPEYSPSMSKEEMKELTWQIAHSDISEQRNKGVTGPRYRVFPKLVNLNKGKYETRRRLWNKTFERWVSDKWLTPSCVWVTKKFPMKPKYSYEIYKIEELGF